MKKILLTILCLAMLAGMLSVGVQAASPSLAVVCPESCAAGETITVDIVADGVDNCSAVGFHLSYDPELMEVSGIVKADSLASWTLVDNPEYASGELAVALISVNSANLSGKIASVSFAVKSSAWGDAAFSLSSLEAESPSSSPIALEAKNGETSISSMEQAMLTVTPSAGENGEVILNIDLSDASYYCGLSFILSYDHSHYTVSGAAKVGDFASTLGAVNPSYGQGKVFVSAAFVTPSSLNGRIATVTLVPVEGAAGEAGDVTVNITNFVDSSYEKLAIGWTWESAAVSAVTEDGSTVSATANLLNSDAAGRKVTAFMALYSADGRFLGIDSESLTVPAGSCGEFPLSLKADSRAEYARVFFMDEQFRPIEGDIDLPLGA